MRFLIFLPVFAFFFYSCKEQQEKDIQQQEKPQSAAIHQPQMMNMDSLRMVIREEVREEERRAMFTEIDPEDNPYVLGGIRKTNMTFPEQTKIYAQPDTTSKIEAVVPFATDIYIIKGIAQAAIQGAWWIKIRNPTDANKIAYMNRNDLADYGVSSYNADGKMGGLLVSEIEVSAQDGYRTVELRRYAKDGHKVLERYRTRGKDSGYRFAEVYYPVTLKKTRNTKHTQYNKLYVYETFTQSCPGSEVKEFILDDGTKLTKLVEVSSVGEGGYFDRSEAYIPMRFGEKILLVADADLLNIFNAQNGTLNVIPYASEYNVPIENIVIVKHSDNGYETDADFDVDPKTVKVNTSFTIYEWDGSKLIKRKDIADKK